MSDYADLYMESFVEVIDSMAKDRGLKKGAFAQKVWPNASPRVAINKWQNMRGAFQSTGQPQVVSIADALRMTEVLGTDLSYAILRARITADEKLAALNIDAPKTKPSSGKQPKKASQKGKTA